MTEAEAPRRDRRAEDRLPGLLIRRVREDEQGLLRELCATDQSWAVFYGALDERWLDQAIRDIRPHGRVAFGAFRHDAEDHDVWHLDGCIFLKRSAFGDAVELKHLTVRGSESFIDAHPRAVARRLIEKAVRFSEVRELGSMEMEIPQARSDLISLGVDAGFRVVAWREKYSQGFPVCTLERRTGAVFAADPFDMEKLSKWLIRSLMPSARVVRVADERYPRFSFEVGNPHRAFQPGQAEHARCIRGTMVIREAPHRLSTDVLPEITWGAEEGQLRYVLAGGNVQPSNPTAVTTPGVHVFSMSDVRRIGGGKESSLRIPIDESEIGGVITVLEQAAVGALASSNAGFVYYLLSDVGAALRSPWGDSPNDAHLLAIYCPNLRGRAAGIVAYAEIAAIEESTFAEAPTRFPEVTNRALSADELKLYATYSEGERVYVLSCRQLTVLDQSCPPRDLVFGSDDARRYCVSELTDQLSTGVYFDVSACESLKALPGSTGAGVNDASHPLRRYAIALSYSSADNEGFVAEVAALLRAELGDHAVFFSPSAEPSPHLKRTDLRSYLLEQFRDRTDLVVLFYGKGWERSNWCGVEADGMRELNRTRGQGTNMVYCFDEPGFDIKSRVDFIGKIEGGNTTPAQVARDILARARSVQST